MRLSKFLIIHPIAVFFLLRELALPTPTPLSDFWSKGSDWNPLPVTLLRYKVTSTWTQNGTRPPQTHSCSLLPHGQYDYDIGVCLQGLTITGRHMALTLELGPRSRPGGLMSEKWNTCCKVEAWKHTLWMPFLPQRKIAFPDSCLLGVKHCWQSLAWRSFFSGNGPWGPALWEGSHTHRESQINIQMSVPITFPLQERSSEPRFVWTILGSCVDTPCFNLYSRPRGQNSYFALREP